MYVYISVMEGLSSKTSIPRNLQILKIHSIFIYNEALVLKEKAQK